MSAGNVASLDSGGDTTLRGATVSGKQVVAEVGGDLGIESLQDMSTYRESGSSSGFGVSVPIAGGTGFSASLNASRTRINSDYQSANTQSGIKAGDEGFQVNVANNTDLRGAVIASTQIAVDQDKNRFQTGGMLTIGDIQNNASYSANSAGVNIGSSLSLDGKLAPSGTSAGFGQESGNASSSTIAGISGIAGNKDVRTGDAETGIGKIFDANKVRNEINAQVQITQAFGQQASIAVGNYVQGQRKVLQESAKNATTSELKGSASDISWIVLGNGLNRRFPKKQSKADPFDPCASYLTQPL